MKKVYLDKKNVGEIVRAALKEDIGPKDVTTGAIIPKGLAVRAFIISKEEGVVCGLPVCEKVFNVLDENIRFKPQLEDGDLMHEGKIIAYLEGEASGILSGERVALNFLSRLSGIATKTKLFVEKANSVAVKIMDTRKTTPGLRYLEKYAVSVGGGYNHRSGLWDHVLIKDNHIRIDKLARKDAKLADLVKSARAKVQKNTKIEIEVNNLKELEDVLSSAPDIIMLDNMAVGDVRKAVQMRNKIGKYPLLEISGNITLDNIAKYASYGADMISIGSLTHSVRSLDLALDIDAAL